MVIFIYNIIYCGGNVLNTKQNVQESLKGIISTAQETKMIIYHYTKMDNWNEIKKGSYKSKHKPGLGASRRMGSVNREAFNTGATFALLEPMPGSWVNNREFNITWDILVDVIGEMLLEVEVYPNKDKAFVVDYGHMDGFQYEHKEGIQKKYLHKTRSEAEKHYIKSKIPIDKYLLIKDRLNYSLPMVVILEDTPIERIKISKHQPLLEKRLDLYKKTSFVYDHLIKDIKRIPELNEWYEREYLKEKEPKTECRAR